MTVAICDSRIGMDTLKLWKKLNALVKTRTPVKTARKMVESGEITKEEISWALAALATLPITMFETMQEKGAM